MVDGAADHLVRVGERKLEDEVPELPARGDGGLELGDLVHGNGERVVLPSARVLEVVVDGGRPVLPGTPVGRDRALDGGRERGDLGEDFGAGTALFRWFLFHAYIIIYAYAKIKREMWGGCINISVHPSGGRQSKSSSIWYTIVALVEVLI